MRYLFDRSIVVFLTSFFCVIVFDPSNSLTGAKEYLFLAIFSWWLINQADKKKLNTNTYKSFFIFCSFGLSFPIFSISSYFFQGGDFKDYEGFKSLIGFLALGFLILIGSNEILALRLFVKVLTLQAITTISIYLFLTFNPEFVEIVTIFGYKYGFLWINDKYYGDFQFLQVFFKTAPFMVLPLAYYSNEYFNRTENRTGTVLILLITCCIALLISGTRANIAFGLCIPAYFLVINFYKISLSKRMFFITIALIFLVILGINSSIIFAMLSPNEESNAVKIGYWPDYIELFSDPIVLLFGQGIGASHYFNSLGLTLLITELSYFELIRNFGLLLGCLYFGFFIAPIFLLKKRIFTKFRWLKIAYACYLLIAVSNYFIMSSTGMVLLSIVYALCFSSIHKNGISLRNTSIDGHIKNVMQSR